jgi:cytosine/adenosine deaminase-related metal-dependent hydrolase
VFAHALPAGARSDGVANTLRHLRDAAGPITTIALGSVLDHAGLDEAAETWAAARALGIRIHAHAGSDRAAPGLLARAAERGLLGDDVTLVHHAAPDAEDLEAVATTGAAISLSPSSEMAAGYGPPPIQHLIDRGIHPGLGVDDERVAPGDLFAQMRATISVQHATVFDRKLAGKAGLPKLMSTRDVLRFATVHGARVAGLRGVTGSIEPGMQADVLVLRTDRPNIFPINDAIGAVVWGMDTSNVDRVVVAGRTILRDGVLDADLDRVRRLALEARDRVGAASGLVSASPTGGGV